MKWLNHLSISVISSLILVSLLVAVCESQESIARIHEERLPIDQERNPDEHDGDEFNATMEDYPSDSAVVPCAFLPVEFIWCEPPAQLSDHKRTSGDASKNQKSQQKPKPGQRSNTHTEQTFGCRRWGGRQYQDVARTKVLCRALKGIECRGNRTFLRGDVPCIRYTGHHFLTTLLYSLLLGFLGIDRFCLGHTGSAVGKLLTLGGVGVWWVVDIVLLIFGDLGPSDDSSWMPYY